MPRTAQPTATPELTVVVPTRNEAANVEPLVRRLTAALNTVDTEIIFVDDSDDETPRTIVALADASPDRIRLLHRSAGARTGGLGGAVVAGFAGARAPWVVVMDGDLQHPPETVPAVLAAARGGGADAVVASRYRDQGRADGLGGMFRRLVSRASGALARLAFPRRLRTVTDPMSGFFAMRRAAVDLAELRPDGYKILMEMLLRGRVDRVVEVPYAFQARSAGESKASLREGLRFVRHLALLRLQTLARPRSGLARVAGFAVAGGTGILVNSVLLWLLGGPLEVPYLVAAFVATQVTIGWNFLVIDNLVMPRDGRRTDRRFVRFLLINNTLVPLHLALLVVLVQGLAMHYLTANLVAIAAVFVVRYGLTSRWVYGTPGPAAVGPAMRRAVVGVRRAALTRIALAVALTALAFPAVAAQMWHGLVTRDGAVPLLIPAVAGAALLVGRLRPSIAEPDVHDRQVDILIASVLLAAAAGLAVMAASGRNPATTRLLAALAFLAAATILLLGTRTAARLRWALILPLVTGAGVVPGALRDGAGWVVREGAALVVRPFVDAGEIGAVARVPGDALAGAVLCLLIASLACFGLRRAVVRVLAASVAVTAVAAATVAVAMLLGPDALRVVSVPAIADAAPAVTVALIVWRWSTTTVVAPRLAERAYMPRGRLALVALAGMALSLAAGVVL